MNGFQETSKFIYSNECNILSTSALNNDDFSIIRYFVEE